MYRVTELDDMQVITEFFSDPLNVKYQGEPKDLQPPIDGFYYLGGFVNDELVTIFLCYNLSEILLDGHIYAKRSAFGFFVDLLRLAVQYVFENLGIITVLIRIPECYKHAISAVKKAGFIECGFAPKSYVTKNGLIGMHILSITNEGCV